ncbi:hypothetical protein FNV43_RR05553 [Rhamnella rubrinervis]|uniref:Uncharacterized protein n=1 Tax=Rhamnella rubrinervis TaxID=2594499 RepID=A0A8K0MRQ3_9ROSA|nr:hypothetical protein FNV43_RR05553 [Rhamnella rubrinervis]
MAGVRLHLRCQLASYAEEVRGLQMKMGEPLLYISKDSGFSSWEENTIHGSSSKIGFYKLEWWWGLPDSWTPMHYRNVNEFANYRFMFSCCCRRGCTSCGLCVTVAQVKVHWVLQNALCGPGVLGHVRTVASGLAVPLISKGDGASRDDVFKVGLKRIVENEVPIKSYATAIVSSSILPAALRPAYRICLLWRLMVIVKRFRLLIRISLLVIQLVGHLPCDIVIGKQSIESGALVNENGTSFDQLQLFHYEDPP